MAMGASQATSYSAAMCAFFAFLMLIIACSSPWTLWGGYGWNSGINAGFVNFGVGPFVAGFTSGSYTWGGVTFTSNVVLWSDLNSANACNPATPIFTQWSNKFGMCSENSAGSYSFVLPSEIQGIQACIILATICSFFTCLTGMSVSSTREGGGYGAAVCSLLAMVFTIAAFAIWTTWNVSTALMSSSGSVIPQWTTGGVLTPSPQVTLACVV